MVEWVENKIQSRHIHYYEMVVKIFNRINQQKTIKLIVVHCSDKPKWM